MFHETPWVQRDNNFQVLINKGCIPRPIIAPPRDADERPRTPWTVQVSLFKDYKIETPSLLNDCFDFDWAIVKKPKFKRDSEEAIKERMRPMYPFL